MTPDTVLTLGDFEFDRLEIPPSINFGGEQDIIVHKLIGGVRVIDAMGRSDIPLEWNGMFTGSNALARARYLDNMRISGLVQTLTFGELNYQVVVSGFHATYERFYQIPYRIICTVVQDNGTPVKTIADQGMDGIIALDQAEADATVAEIGDSTLSGLMGALDTAIKNVSSFANAVQSTINTVLEPLAAVQARVKILIGSVGNVISNVTTVGGVLPNNPIAQQAASVLNQASAMSQLPQLYHLQAVLGRMGGNLASIGSSGNSVTIAGGNLFDLASTNYSDATAWTAIARANGLSDPQLSGVNTLLIPPIPDNSGGVLNS